MAADFIISGPFTAGVQYSEEEEEVTLNPGESYVVEISGTNLELHKWCRFDYNIPKMDWVTIPLSATFVAGSYTAQINFGRLPTDGWRSAIVRLVSSSLVNVASFDIVFSNNDGLAPQTIKFKNFSFGNPADAHLWMSIGHGAGGVTSPVAGNYVISVASPTRVEFIPDIGWRLFNLRVDGEHITPASYIDYIPSGVWASAKIVPEFRRVR